MAKRYNARAIKKHHCYTVEEGAEVIGAHPKTIRAWIRSGLPTLSSKKPMLILGAHLQDYLAGCSASKKQPLSPNEFYCLRCKAAKVPDGGLADYVQFKGSGGRLTGICPSCANFFHRFVSIARIGEVAPDLDVAFPAGQPSLKERDNAA